jgi:hypothetical protein
MFRQVIRELVLLGEEESPDADNEDDLKSEDLEIDDGEDDQRFGPEDGYDSGQDCVNAEDESYRRALEKMEQKDKRDGILYSGGEPVDDEDDIELTTSLDELDVRAFFMDSMTRLSGTGDAGGALVAQLQVQFVPSPPDPFCD